MLEFKISQKWLCCADANNLETVNVVYQQLEASLLNSINKERTPLYGLKDSAASMNQTTHYFREQTYNQKVNAETENKTL